MDYFDKNISVNMVHVDEFLHKKEKKIEIDFVNCCYI